MEYQRVPAIVASTSIAVQY